MIVYPQGVRKRIKPRTQSFLSYAMDIYTDGSCIGNPGRGGWAYYVVATDQVVSGSEPLTTNNRMEMTAVIRALQDTPRHAHRTVVTDSVYVKSGITKWIRAWRTNGWKTARGADVKNVDLWRQLDAVADPDYVRFRWVKGHGRSRWNNIVDRAARDAALRR